MCSALAVSFTTSCPFFAPRLAMSEAEALTSPANSAARGASMMPAATPAVAPTRNDATAVPIPVSHALFVSVLFLSVLML